MLWNMLRFRHNKSLYAFVTFNKTIPCVRTVDVSESYSGGPNILQHCKSSAKTPSFTTLLLSLMSVPHYLHLSTSPPKYFCM